VEHYEIATCGGLVQLAKVPGVDAAAEILQQTLQEGKETDRGLSVIAENNINRKAERRCG
jgi:ferritin-like metal-binding protein YciE